MKKYQRSLFIIGILLVLLGLLGVLPTLYYRHRDATVLNNAIPVANVPQFTPDIKSTLVTGKPLELTIPSLNMHLSIVDGLYDAKTGQWTLSLNKAHYALLSTLPNNEAGNTLIYGHYRPEVFAYLHNIKHSAETIVQTENGYRFIYSFDSSQAVTPSDTSIFAYSGSPQLTLQTCSGAWFQNRQLYKFHFVRYEKV